VTDAPVYYSVSDIAAILGWGYLRTYRWLMREDALVKRGSRLVTTRDKLIATFPEVWQRIAETAGGEGP
jgi:hypothetical protein